MKVDIQKTKETIEPYAVIYCREISAEVLTAAEAIGRAGDVITAYDNGSIVVIDKKDLFMIRAEEGRTRLYTADSSYETSKPLRDFEALSGFMRISKFCIINLEKIKRFDPMFSGTMQVTLKNGSKDYISRKYLQNVKNYLGL